MTCGLTSSDFAPLFKAVDIANAPLFLTNASPRFNVFKLSMISRTLQKILNHYCTTNHRKSSNLPPRISPHARASNCQYAPLRKPPTTENDDEGEIDIELCLNLHCFPLILCRIGVLTIELY